MTLSLVHLFVCPLLTVCVTFVLATDIPPLSVNGEPVLVKRKLKTDFQECEVKNKFIMALIP
jgi:hypothetical protein